MEFSVNHSWRFVLSYRIKEILDRFRKIKMLLFPSDIRLNNFEFDEDRPKSYYLEEFKEILIGCAPEHLIYKVNIRGEREQYGLHYVTGTVHGAMGDT